jgi:regulator of nonsense transcripts 2
MRFLNIRYIAELTKFRITPQHVVFHCLKVLLDDFSHVNIELICQMLEGCGRFLFASPDTSVQMAAMVFLSTDIVNHSLKRYSVK